MNKKQKRESEYRPWDLSYRKSLEALPSWVKHGMPYFSDRFIKLVQENRLPLQKHLDIGCGNGIKTVNFALEGWDTVGIDISSEGFKEAKEIIERLRIHHRCRFLKANCLDLPFRDNSFSSASDILCFTHLKPSSYKEYISGLHRVVANGAYVLMVLFSDKDDHFHGHKVSKNYTFKYNPSNLLMKDYAHYHGMFNAHFNEKNIKETLGDKFKIVEMVEVSHPIYPHRFLWNVILKKIKK